MSSMMIFSFKENYADVAVVKKRFTLAKIKDVIKIQEYSQESISSESYATEENLTGIKELRERNKIRTKDIRIILNWDSIITRVVETPIMNKKELKSFIHNNIEEYFAVSMDEYCYDYEVMGIDEKDKKDRMFIMLAVVPIAKLKEVLKFIKYCGLSPKSIGIYPDYIWSLFRGESDKSTAVLDVNSEKSTLTMLESGRVFLYSSLSNEVYSEDEEKFDDLIDNLDYFLNFYSTRHFGDKITQIYILGELYKNKNLLKSINSLTNIKTLVGIDSNYPKRNKNVKVNENFYADILGYILTRRNIDKKKINFLDRLYRTKNREVSLKKLIWIETAVLSSITIFIILSSLIYYKISDIKYNTSEIDAQISILTNVEKEVDKLENEKKQYEEQLDTLERIEEEQFNYMNILETIKTKLPEDLSVKNIYMDKDVVTVVLSINSNTMDAARAVVAINRMEIFELVELPQVKLNDEVKEISLNLKIRKVAKGGEANGQK